MNTIPYYVVRNYRQWGDEKVAMRHKNLGIWNEYTWKDYYEEVKWASLGLISLGLKPADEVAIIGDNEPWWYWAEIATCSARGIPVGLYVDAQLPEVKYFLEHFGCEFIFSHDQEQVDKVLLLKDELPLLKKAIYWDPKGLRHYDDPILISWEELKELGKKYEEAYPGSFEQTVESLAKGDVCFIAPTSGTTAEYSKGATHTHAHYIEGLDAFLKVAPLAETDEYMGILPPAVAWEQLMVVAAGPLVGMVVNFPEEPETAQADMREISPSSMLYGGTLWDSLASTVQAKIVDTSAFKRFFYNQALKLGFRVIALREQHKRVNPLWQILYKLAHLIVYRPLRDQIGLVKCRHAFNSATLLSPESIRFFLAIGVNLKQAYGSMEMLISCMHSDANIKIDTVGPPVPGLETRISDAGEIVIRSPFICLNYYNDPEKTRDAFEDGWYHTGDAGNIDEEGHLIYYDRVKDLAELVDGHKFSPIYIESKLRFSPYIKTAMVVGRGKPCISAIINIDFETVGRWAEHHGVTYTTFADLSQKQQIANLILADLNRVNKTLPGYSHIQKYVLLHKELDPDEAELTRTWKVRRSFVEERYGNLLNAIYADKPDFLMESEVKYRDGRRAMSTTPVKIRSIDMEVSS